MKFTYSTTLLALTSALLVVAAPVAEPASPSPSVSADDDFTPLDLGNPSLLAAVLDPTWVDANSEKSDDSVMSVNDVKAATSSSVAAKVAATPVIMNFDVIGEPRLLGTPVIRPVAKVSDQVASPSKVQVAAAGTAATRTQIPVGPATIVKTVTNYSTPKPVVVTIPGKTSTFYSTRYYMPTVKPAVPSVKSAAPIAAAAASAKPAVVSQAPAFVNNPRISMVTVTRQSSSMIVYTIPGKTSTTTIKSYYNQWKVRPTASTSASR